MKKTRQKTKHVAAAENAPSNRVTVNPMGEGAPGIDKLHADLEKYLFAHPDPKAKFSTDAQRVQYLHERKVHGYV